MEANLLNLKGFMFRCFMLPRRPERGGYLLLHLPTDLHNPFLFSSFFYY